MNLQAVRFHDICCGHRVVGHEGKCRYLHGHNYRIHFHCEADQLDSVGRVIDFSVIKSTLCEWLEVNWDHKMLLSHRDPLFDEDGFNLPVTAFALGIVRVPFNPTAENMADYLLHQIGPQCLKDSGVTLTRVVIEETRKCSVIATKDKND